MILLPDLLLSRRIGCRCCFICVYFFVSLQLEAGDVILSVNEREVVKLSTKEVLKCLRLSGDIVHIKFKRGTSPHP